MRVFLAVDLSEPIREAVAEAIAIERASVRATWVRAENLHLTLVFIGETVEEKIPEILSACTEVASRHRAFRLSIEGAGTFGGRFPRVLWLGVAGQLSPLETLAVELSAKLEIVSNHAEYRPHLTLARAKPLKGDEALADAAERLSHRTYGSWRVKEFKLYQSAGGRYRPLATIGLG